MTKEGARPDEGGESACFAHVVCPECGAVIGESGHQRACAYIEPEPTFSAVVAEDGNPGDHGL